MDYQERVEFLVIYIREAHPADGWHLGKGQDIHDPRTIEERRAVAEECEAAMACGIKTYIDEMDDAVMTAYVAWPERLYLVDEEGKIEYASGPGPWGFKPEEIKAAIDRTIAQEWSEG